MNALTQFRRGDRQKAILRRTGRLPLALAMALWVGLALVGWVAMSAPFWLYR